MKAPFREIRIRMFIHATEDEERLLGLLKSLLPAGVEVKRAELEGHYGNLLVWAEARLKKSGEIEGFLSNLLPRLEGREELASRLKEFMDKRGNLYLRLDKQEACKGRWVLGRGDEVIHLTLKPKAPERKIAEFFRGEGE